jgi:hypothetical protein
VILFGRDAELAAIDEVLASARAGRGRALFVTGEAGIGKSTLLAEARARASRSVLDGAAWESPGAPPYWPWIQVLRGAEARFGERVRGWSGVARLLGDGEPVADDAVEPAAARFALLDHVVRALLALAADEPLLVVLDDLHAADLPSLELLDLACREIPRAPIAIIGGWRDAELARRPDAAKRLAHASRHARVCALRRLDAAEVTRWVGAEGAAIHAASEGNPLFVEELVRARTTGAPMHAITAVLDDHLALVSPATRDVLANASVLGRELEPALVAAVCDLPLDAIEAALREASTVGLGELRAGRFVFRHVLVRDHVYEALPATVRGTLHRRAGEALVTRQLASADAAHHLLAGIHGDATHAIVVAREAAARALAVYAFEDAAALLAAASRALERHAPGDVATRIDVGLELAEARYGIGAIEAMQAEALRAAELARTAGDGDRFARAVLAYAAELATGRRDLVMIELLESATAMLPRVDGALQARLMARLGAALVPTDDPGDLRPYELADAALAMADRLGDGDAKMFALRYNSHAHGFRKGIEDSRPRVREAIALSDQLGRPLETLEHRTWLANGHLVLGELAAMDGALASLAALLDRMPQPHYQWRMPIVRATLATLRGEFVEADRLIAVARELAREHELDRARMCCSFALMSVALASRSQARSALAVDTVRTLAATIGGPVSAAILSAALAASGDLDGARRTLATVHYLPPIGLSQFGLEAALLADDRVRLELAIPALDEVRERAPMAYGAALSLVMCPIGIVVGEALVRLGRAGDAVAPIESGLALARRLQSPPFIARGAAALASALPARERAQIAALRDEAARLAAGDHIDAPAPEPRVATFAITRRGTEACIQWRGRELHVPSSKGLDYLAALVARPGLECHVSELVGDEDRGDAGEVVDATARAAYKARAVELRDDLAEAEARNDLGRIDRLTAELEMVTDQLVAATGLGGRARRAGSRVERARVNVQRRVRDAIQRLATEDAALGRHLEATIRTGTFCSFTPLD